MCFLVLIIIVVAFLNVCVHMFKKSIATIERPYPVFIYTNRNQKKSSTVLFSQCYNCYNANHQRMVWGALLLEVVAFLPVDALVICLCKYSQNNRLFKSPSTISAGILITNRLRGNTQTFETVRGQQQEEQISI